MSRPLTAKTLEVMAAHYYKKGESGNPNGRPKGARNYLTIYREALELLASKGEIPADVIEVMLTAMQIGRALNGDTKAFDTVTDRAYGKAVQTNLNKNIEDTELDESQVAVMNNMLAKFVKTRTKPKADVKTTKKTASKKAVK